MSIPEEKIRHEPLHKPRVSRGALWFGLLGGGFAWLAHLISAYVIAEFGCISGLGERLGWGVTVVAWMVIGLSVLMLSIAAAATFVARRSRQRLAQEPVGDLDDAGPEFYMARAGFITSALFLFIILVESVPIFFYLKHC
jgi:hypothetical protein